MQKRTLGKSDSKSQPRVRLWQHQFRLWSRQVEDGIAIIRAAFDGGVTLRHRRSPTGPFANEEPWARRLRRFATRWSSRPSSASGSRTADRWAWIAALRTSGGRRGLAQAAEDGSD